MHPISLYLSASTAGNVVTRLTATARGDKPGRKGIVSFMVSRILVGHSCCCAAQENEPATFDFCSWNAN